MRNPQGILITGASSGLGETLALAYAKEGVTLFLGGRNADRLQAVTTLATSKGALALSKIIDVCDEEAMARWVQESHAVRPLDLIIANAGISAGTGKGDESPAQSQAIFATNLQGVFHTLWPAITLMKRQGYGQVALMSSLAGFRGLAGAPSYCASKAAVRVYGESLRNELAPLGVEVNVICPGFIKTPMTEVNDFPMPFLMTPEKAARLIQKGLAANRPRIAFPRRLAALIWLVASLSPCLTDTLLAKLPRKP